MVVCYAVLTHVLVVALEIVKVPGAGPSPPLLLFGRLSRGGKRQLRRTAHAPMRHAPIAFSISSISNPNRSCTVPMDQPAEP
jgi:hypothetical protein